MSDYSIDEIRKALLSSAFGFFDNLDTKESMDILLELNPSIIVKKLVHEIRNGVDSPNSVLSLYNTGELYNLTKNQQYTNTNSIPEFAGIFMSEYSIGNIGIRGLYDIGAISSTNNFTVYNSRIINKIINLMKERNPTWFDGNKVLLGKVLPGTNDILHYSLFFDNWEELIKITSIQKPLAISYERFNMLCDAHGVEYICGKLFSEFFYNDTYFVGDTNAPFKTFVVLDVPRITKLNDIPPAVPVFIQTLMSMDKIIKEIPPSQLIELIDKKMGGDFSGIDHQILENILVKVINKIKTFDWKTVISTASMIKELGVDVFNNKMTPNNRDMYSKKVVEVYSNSYILRYASVHRLDLDELVDLTSFDEINVTDSLEFLVQVNVIELDTILDILKSVSNSKTFVEFINYYKDRYPTISYMLDVHKLMS